MRAGASLTMRGTMSSGTPVNPAAAGQVIAALGNRATGGDDTPPPTGPDMLSPRQRRLNRLWAYYRCTRYDERRVDWNGVEATSADDVEVIASQGYAPPGFFDAGATFPLKFRRPTAPANIAKVVVNRYTALLFGTRRNPRFVVEGDEDTEDYLNCLATEGRLWDTMRRARAFGGAMGSWAASFKLVRGRPVFEAHDPRWCTPKVRSHATGELESLEIRYCYDEDVRDPETGAWIKAWFWRRRVIDTTADELWPKVPVGDGEEPAWDEWKSERVEHGLGLCPAVWGQNVPLGEDVDGDPDCHGTYEIMDAYDALLAQANKSILGSCDPTLLLSTDSELDSVGVGSDNAIKLEKGASGQFLEVQGTAAQKALDLAGIMLDRIYDLTGYVPDDMTDVAKTATEVNSRVARMFEHADALREQYGAMGAVLLMEKAEHAVRKLTKPVRTLRTNDDGTTTPVVQLAVVRLPRRVVKDKATGTVQAVPRKLGPGGVLGLRWPPYFTPTLDDVEKAARAATTATGGKPVINDEVAARFVAPYFGLESADQLVDALRQAAEQEQAELEQALANSGAMGGGAGGE